MRVDKKKVNKFLLTSFAVHVKNVSREAMVNGSELIKIVMLFMSTLRNYLTLFAAMEPSQSSLTMFLLFKIFFYVARRP